MSETFDITPAEADAMHYGIQRLSGRYPWGSGDNPNQRAMSFFDIVAELKKNGATEAQIAEAFSTPEHPFTTTDLRATRTLALAQKKADDIARAEYLKTQKGYSNVAIGREMGINESSVRALLAPGAQDRHDILIATANMLRKEVDKNGAIDVGGGVENHLKLSRTKLDTAIAVLKAEGYKIEYIKAPQVGTGKMTTYKVLADPKQVKWSELVKDPTLIKTIVSQTVDKGRNWLGIDPPLTVDPKRVSVRYKENGGDKADGVIYIRPGVKDISLGGKQYAQVRIAVGDGHYLKGMAMYKNDLPKGVDLEFNTNKSFTGSKLDAMKKISDDPENPFGSIVRQLRDEDGKVYSAMNIVNEQGDWDKWGRNLSSQMLSKQSPVLAKQQLDVTYERRKDELENILRLSNPAIRRKLLEDFADGTDAAAVHLKAAAMPGQSTRVILPINSLKDNEVYAPGLTNGDRVVLIRYPHGGTFEIPELLVNNRHPESKKALGETEDAIGINAKVAARLSGADFDGDTVLVIPNNRGSIQSSPALARLKDFDPQALYKLPDEAPRMSPRTKGIQMGDVSNLITDMTIKGASHDELARAVRHSMVVIDAEKHHLDYKKSAKMHGIAALKEKYQGDKRGGAATLISRKKRTEDVPERKDNFKINPTTGERIYTETGRSYVNKAGVTVFPTSKVKQLDNTKDAHSMVSDHGGTKIERVYADHSNRMKALANMARKEQVATSSIPYSPSAKKAYAPEVAALNAKLNLALMNRPLERNAQIIANGLIAQKKAANPDMGSDELKKVRARALNEGRRRTGAGKDMIEITPREWDAIQAGAISNNIMSKILNNTDIEKVKALATPREVTLMTGAKTARAQSMLASGYTQAEVAAALGVSLTTLKTGLG